MAFLGRNKSASWGMLFIFHHTLLVNVLEFDSKGRLVSILVGKFSVQFFLYHITTVPSPLPRRVFGKFCGFSAVRVPRVFYPEINEVILTLKVENYCENLKIR